ncbi:hypothetical protein [Roseovarius sp. 217]|uniref:hypothetical protein n=1 Tax=Roseovarius sp. (strain 217) TaxID=314264 RepID=UPI00006855AC|nr:hypothetical protein [Roseovarius sp. 217]EAQ24928.1 thiamine biosynthesis protein ThiC [Roseovarius sp. 217]
MRKILLTIVTVILSTPMAIAQMSKMEGMNHGTMTMDKASAEEAMLVDATVNSINEDSVNVSHAPISEID